MPVYPIVLFLHLLCLVLAVVASSLAAFAQLRLRAAATAGEAAGWLAVVRRVVRIFPAASLGLLATGGYMAWATTNLSAPWVLASLIGLVAISGLGAGVEGSRMRALAREMQAAGLSDKARRLARDPLAWSAKMTTFTLVVAVMFIMTAKPAGEACALILAAAVIAGGLAAVPLWSTPRTEAAEVVPR
jgi:hypothetical protein